MHTSGLLFEIDVCILRMYHIVAQLWWQEDNNLVSSLNLAIFSLTA